MKSTQKSSDSTVQHLQIHIGKTAFNVYGDWKSQSLEKLGTQADLDLSSSFDSKVILDKTNLIYPDDISRVEKIFSSARPLEHLDYSFRIITGNLDVQLLEGSGIVELSGDSQADLLKATMDSSPDMIQVFQAVRNQGGEIIDFIWILNNHASEKIYGDVIGKSLLENNPGVVEVGIFNTFKTVVETGLPDRTERHYVHEQFNGWFMQSTVKLKDGIATTTTNITHLKEIERQLKKSKEQLQATLDSSPYIVQAFEAVRENEKIIDFRWAFNNKHAVKQNGDVIGKSLVAQNPGVIDSGLFDQFVRVTETGEPVDQEVFYDYEQFNAWYRQTLVKMGDGFVMTTEDVTSRKMTETELRESKNTIDKIATTTPDLITIQDTKTSRLTFVNNDDFWKDLLPGVNVHDLHEHDRTIAMIHPDYLEKSRIFLEDRRLLKDGEVTEAQLRLINGNWIGIRSKVFKRDDDGNASQIISFTSNITVSKIAEQEMQKTMHLLQSVMDNTESSLMVLAPVRNNENNIIDFEYVFTNEQTLRSVGKTVLKGKRFTEEFPEVKDSSLFREYANVMDTGADFRKEIDISPFGISVWSQVFARKIGGQLLITYFDISERRKTEQQLIESKNLLQTVFDVSLNPIAYHQAVRDDRGNITDFKFQLENLEARKYAIQDRTGQRYSEAYPGIKDTVVFKMYCDVVNTGKQLNEEVQLSLKGTERWFQLMAAKLGDGLVATAVDITERKKAEQEILRLKDEVAQRAEDKYRKLFNSMQEGFCLIEIMYDENGKAWNFRYLEVNPAFKIHTGIGIEYNKTVRDYAPNVSSDFIEMYAEVARTGTAIELTYFAETRERWFHLNAARFGSPEMHQVAILFSDVTERKQREQQQQFLMKFSDALRTERDADAIANRAVRMLAEHLRLDRCYVGIASLADNRAIFPYQFGSDRVAPMPEQGLSLSDFPEALRKAFDETLVITDLKNTPDLTETEKQNFAALGFCALVVANVRKEERNPHWSINAVSSTPRSWTDIEVHLVEEATERTWAAVERARAEQAITASEEKYRLLFDSIDEGYCIVNVLFDEKGKAYDYRFVETNPAFNKQTGWEEAVGKTMKEIAPRHEQFWFDTYGQVAATGLSLRFEHFASQIYAGVWYDVYAFRIGEPEQRQVAIIFNDITERKLREAQNDFIIKLSDALRPISDPVEIKRVAVNLLGHHLRLDRALYCEINLDQDYFEISDNYTRGSVQQMTGRFPYSAFGPPGEKGKKGEILTIDDVAGAEYTHAASKVFFRSMCMRL